MTKRLGGVDWMQHHSAVYEKAEHSWSEKWNAKERTLVVLKRWPFIQAIYVCFVILETLLLRKWTPKLAGYRGQFLNCFILIPSRAGVGGKLLYWYDSICLRYLKIFAIIQFESFQLDIIKFEIFFLLPRIFFTWKLIFTAFLCSYLRDLVNQFIWALLYRIKLQPYVDFVKNEPHTCCCCFIFFVISWLEKFKISL